MFAGGVPVIIPFLTAGFPNVSTSREAAIAAWESGAGAIEVGMPFSDPLADGPAIQHSSQTALSHGVTIRRVLELTGRLRARLPIPIFLMGYFNPVMRMGLDEFASAAYAAGASGTIIPDCPIEEAGAWLAASRRHHLDNVFLVAPTSSDERIRRIERHSTVFSYCVSIAGVTGARRDVSAATKSYLARVRRIMKKPYVVGFGISRPEHVRQLRGLADGFVVGSALVPLLEQGRQLGPSRVAGLVRSLVTAARET
jgi:tryptophan synthase alpha chain